MKLTIIVTVYNEVKTIKQAIDDVMSLGADKEIIVIDNCSTDGTKEVLQNLNYNDIKIVYQDKNLGFGTSIQKGLSLAKGEYIYVQFSDLEYDYKICLSALKEADETGCDAVFGSRLKDIIKTRSIFSLLKEKPAYLATLITTYLINKWYGYQFTDVLGAKFYRTESLRKVIPKTRGMGFDFELVSLICKKGFNIKEIPVKYTPRARNKDKKIKPYHMLNALWAIFKVRYL